MEFNPCPACGYTSLKVLSLTDAINHCYITAQKFSPRSELVQSLSFHLMVICPNCKAVFPPGAIVQEWPIPELKQDGKGYYVEGEITAFQFPFTLSIKVYIKEELEEGRDYITSVRILNTKKVEDLPEILCIDNKGLRALAIKRLKELKQKT